ncbi:ABC transporter permease [Danxiaibacter flavus]|uniref:ABC transporter permease n=1 Tax=Danxiaibacter flavus TaxID=3049108 RepID=A0ABV3ZIX0_9BACT|nr:ABC transporter permease [Chitinophagaceae bacterium DXS]
MNYFKTMFRSLRKKKVFTLINLFGFSTGMAVCLLLVLYVQSELGWDSFHKNSKQIYRLAVERKYTSRTSLRGTIPPSIGQAVKKEFAEVEESVRVMDISNSGISIAVGEKNFLDDRTLVVDSNFFKVFDGNFVEGDVQTALASPESVVLNEGTAKRFFGSAKMAMGKQITLGYGRICFVSGVCKDWPEKSHLQFNVLVSMTGNQGMNDPNYYDFYTYNYLLLNKNVSAKFLESKLPLIVEKYVAPTIEKGFGETYQQFIAEGNGYRYFLQPINQIHLRSFLVDEMKPGGNIQSVRLFIAIGIFILLLACINFINLSTAISVERAREVGIRKTFGSGKGSIIMQFLSESVVFSFVSMVLAVVIALLLLPQLNKVVSANLSFNYFFTAPHLAMIAGFAVLTGIIAGLYPAFILSGFKPITVLKGQFKSGIKGIQLRNVLVVFQFVISVVLIICTIVLNNQMHFVLDYDLGFNKDNVIAIDNAWYLRSAKNTDESFINELRMTKGITDISKCSGLPGGKNEASCAMQVVGTNVQRTQKTIFVDHNYQKTLNLKLKEGRFFSKDFATDSFSLVLNETAVKDFQLKNPIGAKITSTETFFNSPDGKPIVYTVVGVIEDYHFESMHDKISPLVITNSSRFGWGTMALKVSGNRLAESMNSIEHLWKQFEPKHDIQLSFLDKSIENLYKSERNALKIISIFSLLAISIACTGLLGLVTYATLQRTKEIGIRKVLGASAANIIMILSRDFLRLITISILLAFPLAWWATNKWLEKFAYHIQITWWIFAVAGASAVLIALFTISFQAIKAAVANPVNSLRNE